MQEKKGTKTKKIAKAKNQGVEAGNKNTPRKVE